MLDDLELIRDCTKSKQDFGTIARQQSVAPVAVPPRYWRDSYT